MDRFSGFVLRHRLLIALVWLAAACAGAFAALNVPDRLVEDFAPPGSAARDANAAIVAEYRTGGDAKPLVPVVKLPAGTSADTPAVREGLRAAFAAAGNRLDARVVSYADTGDVRFTGDGGRTVYGLVYPQIDPGATEFDEGPDPVGPITEAMRPLLPSGTELRVTSMDGLEEEAGSEGPSVLTETLVGGLGALVVLAFVFGSVLAVVPLVIAVVSILSSFLLVYALTGVTEVNFMVQFVVALIGLGVAVDYSLLLVTRWREERARGLSTEDATRRAMATAGHAVVFSAAAVAIGLVAMLVVPVAFLRSVAYGGVIIPAVSALVTLTLLPVTLVTVGPALDRIAPRWRSDGARAGRAWTGWARRVVRFRTPAALAALAVLGGLAFAALGLNLGEPSSGALAKSGPAYEGLADLRRAGVPSGVLTPVDVLLPVGAGADPAATAAELRALPGVHAVAAPAGDAWRRGGTALVTVLPVAEGGTDAGKDVVKAVRDAVPPGARVGGETANDIDFVSKVYGTFPLMLALICVLTFVLLARAFRSLLLAVKAVLLNLLSLAAVLGAIALVWQQGHGSDLVWGISATGSIASFVPAMVFAFLYGLSMDYEVFILARLREEYDRTGSTEAAVVEGLGRTGRLVTSAALILFLAFASLAAAPIVEVKIFATGLGIGILLDATVVRALLVPAMVSLFGRWNWWLPGWAARVLRVPASPLPSSDERERVPIPA
ncbi:RND superfamily putative drug exporter [Actinomadura pelletieri DSM 43383]|uniref:RND superfamily putative drug exporter n=1 Tax=Actinomadura pelletieri DSM 43383 TaxID=1120940 RepID=A0A495QM75_9ACTN|nr:MMPL family transporter [Actinomadura pelletieri]RKS73633.1 RND superfamily putative drug exporter [Actinomadura pelletieri DSM 43383]